MAGHPVVAIAPIPGDLTTAPERIRHHLLRSYQEGLTQQDPQQLYSRLVLSEDYNSLKASQLVIECTLENMEVKKSVYQKIESVVGEDTLVTSNTSAIPITLLQAMAKVPQRFFGLHWAEPSHTTRFLEIICGEQSRIDHAEYLYQLSHYWGKEPTLVQIGRAHV